MAYAQTALTSAMAKAASTSIKSLAKPSRRIIIQQLPAAKQVLRCQSTAGDGIWMPLPSQQAYDGYIGNPNVQHKKMVDQMIRVDHAGEVAAVKIYEGQMWVLRGTPAYQTISHMKTGEIDHLNTMNSLMAERRARPTALLPVCEAAGFALGAATALLGKEAAMACTVAVETVIGEHYNDQIRDLLQAEQREEKLVQVFKRHRDEELQHLDTATANDAEKAPLFPVLSQIIKWGCQAAIWTAKRI